MRLLGHLKLHWVEVLCVAALCALPAYSENRSSQNLRGTGLREFSTDSNTTLGLFQRILQTYRGTGEEDITIELIRSFVDECQPSWRHRLSSQTDAQGNLLVRLPATRGFARRRVPPIALQTNVDMPTVTTNRRTYLRFLLGGIKLAETGDEIHSEDLQSNVGASSGLGIALALRYIADPSLEHPPLELMFTVEKEWNFNGARHWELPIESHTIIGLNADRAGQICIGCQGTQEVRAYGDVPTVELPASYHEVSLDFNRLVGGDSTVDVHRRRVHAIMSAASFLNRLTSKYDDVYTMAVASGDHRDLRVIPNSFRVVLAIPAHREPDLLNTYRQHVQDELAQTEDGRLELIEHRPLAFAAFAPLRNGGRGISPEVLQPILQAILSIPHGVLAAKRGSVRPLTSSNAGHWILKFSDIKNRSRFRFGVVLNSYRTDDLELHRQAFEDVFEESQGLKRLHIVSSTALPPQMFEKESDFHEYLKALGLGRFVHSSRPLETSVFADRFPEKNIIAVGATIHEPDTSRERISRESVRQTIAYLDALLREIPYYYMGKCRDALRQASGRPTSSSVPILGTR